MRAADLLSETLFSLTTNKVRSGLTILGIVVGIGSVILMVAIGQGSQASIEKSIQSAGSNLLMVTPGFGQMGQVGVRSARGSAETLTREDADAIGREIKQVAAVAPQLNGQYQVIANRNNTNVQVLGTVAEYAPVKSLETSRGVFLSLRDEKSYAKVAVLGPTTAKDLFGEGVNPVGQWVRISNIRFKVIGTTAAKGGSGFNNTDDMVYVPLTTMQRFLVGSESITLINVQATSADAMSDAKNLMTSLLLGRHGIANPDEADFSVMSQEDILQTASTITGTFTALLASIAAISLVVGGIGIMNMMLTTVTERTREIGLRKAVGATRADVTAQFLTESVTLTVLGGALGIGLGWGLSLAITAFAGLNTKISWGSVGLAVGVCAAIGIVFGYYPAWRAARLNPIEALRYQ